VGDSSASINDARRRRLPGEERNNAAMRQPELANLQSR
jgi:hypothetical protein